VTLSHLGWGEGGQWDEAFKYFDNAWGRVLANLEKRFAEGPTDWTGRLKQLKDATPAAPDAKPRVLRVEKIVNAPPAEVWKSFSTVEGLQAWVGPVVALDLRNGGNMRVQPTPKKAIGAPGTVHLDILTVVEPEVIIYRTHLPDSFPAKVRAEDS